MFRNLREVHHFEMILKGPSSGEAFISLWWWWACFRIWNVEGQNSLVQIPLQIFSFANYRTMNNESSFQNKKESEFNIARNTYSTLPMDQFSSDFKCISSDFQWFLLFLFFMFSWKGSKPYLFFLSRINFLLLIFHSFCCCALNLPTF